MSGQLSTKSDVILPPFEIWNKERRESPKKYNTHRSELSRITGEKKRLEYLGFRIGEFNAMCKEIVTRY